MGEGWQIRKIRNFDLLNAYLRSCSKMTEKLLSMALFDKSTNREGGDLAKEVSHVANVLSAIYFFRYEKDLEKVLQKMPLEQSRSLELSFRIVWKYLCKMNETEIAELAIQTIQESANLGERIEIFS